MRRSEGEGETFDTRVEVSEQNLFFDVFEGEEICIVRPATGDR